MCGRATLTTPQDTITAIFDVAPIDIGPPRYNLAPTQPILTVRLNREERRELALMRWGLIPWWAKPDEAKRVGAKCIQARSETVRKAPAFRDAFKRHRCLVVVDGFFEWSGEGKARAPFLARREGGLPFAIAGLWDKSDALGERIESATVLTTRANGPIRAIHDRMPVILEKDEWQTWLTAADDEAAQILKLPRTSDQLITVPVSKWVNDAKHDDPQCLAPPDTESE
jgi:putative SOS response-associated peptidase YedK